MKTNHYRKRLDRVRDGLFPRVGGDDTVIFYSLFGVPDLDQAVARARKIGTSSVMHVPADGDEIQFFDCDESENAPSGIAVAFEMAEPVGTDSGDPYKLLTDEQLGQIIRNGEAILAAVAGGKESVSVVTGGKVVFKVNVSPEKCP